MHAPLRFVVLLALGASFSACSSSDASNAVRTDGGAGTNGSGGKQQGAAGAKSTGGVTGAAGKASGGATGTQCAADAGSDNCRMCLAQQCCDRFTDCMGDSLCSTALGTHETCFRKPGAEQSACFGELTRTLRGEAGESAGFPPIAACIITNCKLECGGPNPV